MRCSLHCFALAQVTRISCAVGLLARVKEGAETVGGIIQAKAATGLKGAGEIRKGKPGQLQCVGAGPYLPRPVSANGPLVGRWVGVLCKSCMRHYRPPEL